MKGGRTSPRLKSKAPPSASEELFGYVERFFLRHERTEFPTVARVARSLRWTQEQVEQAVDDSDGKLMLTSYHVLPEPSLGEHFVESLNDADQEG